jgi:hypothetical protein
MLQLIHFALLTLGLTYIVTQSSIMVLPRMWLAEKAFLLKLLIYCPACTGFWVGVALQLVHNYGFPNSACAGISACGLMATWAAAFLPVSSWTLEQEDAPSEKKETHGS